jgi:Ca2+-binding RTX toxin-like protein
MMRIRSLAVALAVTIVGVGLLPSAPAAGERRSPADDATTVSAGGPSSVVWGTDGDDTLIGDDTPQTFYALPGSDFVDGAGGDDWIGGNAALDHLIGGPGQDTVRGGSGNDLIEVADGEVDDVRCGNGLFDQVVSDL